MNKFIKEIHKQPAHIREIFMWLSIIIVFGTVGVFALKEAKNNLVAAINPMRENISADRAVAEDKNNENSNDSESPFALILDSIKDLRSDNNNDSKSTNEITIINSNPRVPPSLFPVTE